MSEDLKNKIIRISNVSQYVLEFIDGDLILTPKPQKYLAEEEFKKLNFANSKIVKYYVKNREGVVISNAQTKYFPILLDIWKSMPTSKMVQNTTFNMALEAKSVNGYDWYPGIKVSVQRKDTNGSIKEMLQMVKLCEYSMEIAVELETGATVNYKNE